MKLTALSLSATLALALFPVSASAATLSVGTGKTYSTIADAFAAVMPGDIIEVQGDQTYTGSILFTSDHNGTKDQPITVRGIPVNGHRPLLQGVGGNQYDNMVVFLNANHFVMESFEVQGDGTDTDYCLVHEADDVTLRDLVVHDCPHQAGLVGADNGSGSLTLEYSEFFHNGTGDESHQIYMATDEAMFPGSVFRMQYCYVHDGTGGNNVQSRAERNEIYYNWIEGAYYHELDLIGPDTGDPNLAREDSDVVGNVLIKTSEWRIARIGGDDSGNSAGRYRFVNNTMFLGTKAATAITLQQTVDSLEMYNNVIYRADGAYKIYDVTEQLGPDAALFGSNNWIVTGATGIPTSWTATTMGSDPGLVDMTGFDFRPNDGSPLIDAGTTTTATTGDFAFPSPLALPAFSPPARRLLTIGSAAARQITGAPDLGAYEANAAAPGQAPSMSYATPTAATTTAPDSSKSGCSCSLKGDSSGGAAWLASGALLALVMGRKKARRLSSSHC